MNHKNKIPVLNSRNMHSSLNSFSLPEKEATIGATKSGFTLVELIVVITILAILGTIAFISLQGYSATSRDSVRISDTGNMKTALELFHLNSGKYPLPDNYGTLSYSSNDLFYQGTFGKSTQQSVSRNMTEIPTDPLTGLEYIYSVSNNKNKLEILTLLEGDDYVYNPLAPLLIGIAAISQTNAAGIEVVPRITGNYNGLFVKTSSHIVPLPSIINTEVDENIVTELTQSKIESMVTNLGENIPEYGNVVSSTGALTNITLSVWTGSLTTDSDSIDKLEVYTALYDAYTGSSLVTTGIIADLLSRTTDEEKLAITETVVLNTTVATTTVTTTPTFVCGDSVSALGKTYTTITGPDGNCWTSQNMRHGTMLADGATMPSDYATIEKWCYNNDSTICDTDGGLYTWNEAMGYGTTNNEDITKSVCGVLGAGWHLPTDIEQYNLENASKTLGQTCDSTRNWVWDCDGAGWTLNKLSGIISSLPGFRYTNASFYNRSTNGGWWSSTEYNATNSWSRYLYSGDSTVYRYNNNKDYGFSVVCIKN